MKYLLMALNMICMLTLVACGGQEYSTGSISNLAATSPLGATDQNSAAANADASTKSGQKDACESSSESRTNSSTTGEIKPCEKKDETDHDNDHHEEDDKARGSSADDEDCSD
ncbi:MAG: hypothetical protein ACO3A4_07390 [Silvanigrellaceae bacterium]